VFINVHPLELEERWLARPGFPLPTLNPIAL
jgi:hypothetical protein